ncbi:MULTISPECIES: hypothetical protein [Pseudomonas]|uniref:DUF5983 family protein n=1 Tax=Pseudomonas TaxID=286 RepID=UPI00021732C3|nr:MULTISPECIES: hypothetical protein [Pseudomonas]AEJ12921.1 conserved hypothetical protein [Pseudomonas putida S16]WOB61192.1 hypothetical protein NY023_12325 [Pseudomonas sp. NBB]
MLTSTPNPFARGFHAFACERVVQIHYDDQCPPCYRSLHTAQLGLDDDHINCQACVFDDDCVVITEGQDVSGFLRMQLPADGVVTTVLYQVTAERLTGSVHLGDLPSLEAAEHLMQQLSFATGQYSRSWEISSSHLPADEYAYLEQLARCERPAGYFECFRLVSNRSVGCKLYSTPWHRSAQVEGLGCSAADVCTRLLDEQVPPVLMTLLLLAGQADTRFLVFDPDAAPLAGLPLFADD